MIRYTPAPGATPLDMDEMDGLIPRHITNQSELNAWEQQNILQAESWAFHSTHDELLTIAFLKKLHQKMFGNTWRWAGVFRNSSKNVGVDAVYISTEIKKLLDDVAYQIEYKTYIPDEIAFRFHHRLVFIHPFANGNGRHARTMTDLLLVSLNHNRFSWGANAASNLSEVRQQYIAALKLADKQDYSLLANFVRG